MDIFMDKLSEKLTAQEMINANAAADAEEMSRLKEQIKGYDDCLEQMQKINRDLQAVNEQISKLPEGVIAPQVESLVQESVAKLKEFQAEGEALKEIKMILDEKMASSEENVHKECVKVYRNVQAVVVEECGKQSETIAASAVAGLKGKLNAILRISIVSLIVSLVGVVFQVLTYLNIL